MSWNKNQKFNIRIEPQKEELTNFPILINLSNDSSLSHFDCQDLFDKLNIEGTDNFYKYKIKIEDDQQNQLYVEIESWEVVSSGIARARLWTKVPTIYSNKNTELNLYYDETQPDNTNYVGTTGSTPAQQVWDSNFVAVYHLAQDPAGTAPQILDSTSIGADGTTYGSMTSSDLIESHLGKTIKFDGVDDYVNCGYNSAHDITDTLTLEVVFSPTNTLNDTLTHNLGIVSRQFDPTDSEDSYALFINADGKLQLGTFGGNIQSTVSTWNAGKFFVVAVSYESTGLTGDIFIDGVADVLSVNSFDTMSGSTNNLVIGKNADTGDFWPGKITEVRISNIVRSDYWIKATNDTIKDQLTFIYPDENSDNYYLLQIEGSNEDLYNFPILLNITDTSGKNSFDCSNFFEDLKNAHPESVDDDFSGFDGEPPSTKLWRNQPGFIQNNKLRMSGNDYQLLHSVYKIKGDFDIQVDVDIVDGPNTDSWSASLHFFFNTNDIILMSRRYDGGNHFYHAAKRISGTWSGIASSTTSDTNCKLRVTKTGSTFEFFYWNGTSWQSIGTDTIITGELSVNLEHGPWSNFPYFTIDFDNFKINQGAIIWPSSKKFKVVDKNKNQHYVEIENFDWNNYQAQLHTLLPILPKEGAQLKLAYDYTQPDNTTITPEEAGDDFTGDNGSTPNPYKWFINKDLWYTGTQKASIDIYNNKLRFNLKPAPEDQGNIASFFQLQGDFDIQVDFDLSDNTNCDWLSLYIWRNEANRAVITARQISELFRVDSSINNVWQGAVEDTGITFTTGTLRLNRTDSTIFFYYDIGSGWVTVTSMNCITDDVFVVLQTNGANTSTDTVYFDNFKVNYADSISGYVGDTASAPAQAVWYGYSAVYHMAQDPTQQILDSTSETSHGTTYGSMTYDDLTYAETSRAIKFDGTDDYIEINNICKIINDNSLTIESIIYKDTIPVNYNDTITSFHGNSGNTNRFLFWVCYDTGYANSIPLDLNATVITSIYTTNVCDSKWHTITTNFNNDNYISNIYLDGILASTASGTTSWEVETDGRASIGQEYDSSSTSDFFEGYIQELRFSATIRTDDWINTTHKSLTDDLIDYFIVSATYSGVSPKDYVKLYGKQQKLQATTYIIGDADSYTYDTAFYVDNSYLTTVSGTPSGQPVYTDLETLSGKDYEWYMITTSSGFSITSPTYNFYVRYLCSGICLNLIDPASGVDVRLHRRSSGELVGKTTTAGTGTFHIDTPFNEQHYAIALHPSSGINALIYDHLTP